MSALPRALSDVTGTNDSRVMDGAGLRDVPRVDGTSSVGGLGLVWFGLVWYGLDGKCATKTSLLNSLQLHLFIREQK